MTSRDIVHHRLINQGILSSTFTEPEEVVRWMGCIQAQDFAGAKWAIGNRIKGITEAEIENDFNEGKILRTHILRPTWHFVNPEDIHWMLKHTAPKIKALSKGLHRKLDIDDAILKRSKKIISKALQDGNQLTRDEIQTFLKKGKINTDDIRLGFLIMDAELDGIICSGKRQGKQFTYALLEERAPKVTSMDRDAAIAELGKRYFLSRGPATVQDFAWWSGLTLTEAKQSIELNKKHLAHEVVNGEAFWFSSNMPVKQKPARSIHVLPPFDEYAVAYKGRTEILATKFIKKTGHGIFKPTIIMDGQIIGIWKRTEMKDNVHVEISPFISLSKVASRQIRTAVQSYASFTSKALVETN